MRGGPQPAPTGASAKRSSLCGASKFAKVGSGRGSNLLNSPTAGGVSQKELRSTKRSSLSAGGPKLLKWDLPGRGSNLLKSGRPLTSTAPRQRDIRARQNLVPKSQRRARRRSWLSGKQTKLDWLQSEKSTTHASQKPELGLPMQKLSASSEFCVTLAVSGSSMCITVLSLGFAWCFIRRSCVL